MVAKRKKFICRCGKSGDKTAGSYYAQLHRLGYVLCTECSTTRNANETSKRLLLKYEKQPKNKDYIIYHCDKCGQPKKMQRRALRDGYTICKKCAAIRNRLINKEKYTALSKQRQNNQIFATAVSNGMLNIPFSVRSERSLHALQTRWDNNKLNRLSLFIQQANLIHNNRYTYNKVEYVNWTTPLIITCPEHGDFIRTPKEHLHSGYGCNRCAQLKTISSGHEQISEFIKSFGYHVENNIRDIITPYEIDIWIPDIKLGIEYHGVYWHSYDKIETTEERNRHKTKSDIADSNNIRLLQIFETEWLQRNDIIKSIIRSKIGHTNKYYARKCTVQKPSDEEYKKFMDENHLQGYRQSSYTLGLYTNTLVAAIGISKHPNYNYELIRFATIRDTTIVGGLSKLLYYAKRDLQYNQLLSYADRRYSNGSGYLACDFRKITNTKPNYFYTTGDKFLPLYSRQHFQKHKLVNRLQKFDNNLSESDNMFENGYRRIWDAGHIKLLQQK